MFLIVVESFLTESSYSARIALSSASSADDIPSVSSMRAGVEDLLLIGVGDDDDEEFGPGDFLSLGPIHWSKTSCRPSDWLAVLFVIDVSGELTPESVDV